jgi:hypothetical protein
VADVSAEWLAEIAKGTPQEEVHSQRNHPNLKGHKVAAEAILNTISKELTKK